MRDVLAIAWGELCRIFRLRPVFSVLVLAPLLYAAFYPQPYLNEVLRDVPLAVVDQDGTVASREFVRRVDASSDVAVAAVLPDLATAEQEVLSRQLDGVLLIPRNFERDLLHGRPAPVALYADASYMLLYQRLSSGVSGVARAFGAEVEAGRLVATGVDPALAAAATDPLPLTAVPLFNPQSGYATYALPAAFVLILQQVLLIGTGLLCTLPRGQDAVAAGPAALVLGRLLAVLPLQGLTLCFYLVAMPWLLGIPRLGPVWQILFTALPFVLAVAGLGQVIAVLFRKPLTVQLVMAAVGLPFFFMAGFAWPPEAIPDFVLLPGHLLPSSTAIEALVAVAQMGASLADVGRHVALLWGLALAYGLFAMLLTAWRGPNPQL